MELPRLGVVRPRLRDICFDLVLRGVDSRHVLSKAMIYKLGDTLHLRSLEEIVVLARRVPLIRALLLISDERLLLVGQDEVPERHRSREQVFNSHATASWIIFCQPVSSAICSSV